MVVRINDINAGPGPQGEFHRPGGARFEPGSGTHTLIPNRYAQVTVDVGPPMMPVPSIHGREDVNHLMGSGTPGGEVVLGTDVVVPSTANDFWLHGGAIPSYDIPFRLEENAEFGRHSVDLFANEPVPRFMPTYPGDSPVEDRSM